MCMDSKWTQLSMVLRPAFWLKGTRGSVQETLPTGGLKPAVTILSERYWQTVRPISSQWALCQMDIWNKSKLLKKSSLWLASKDSFSLTDTSTTPLGCQGELSVILWAPYFRGNGNNPILVLMNDDWGNSTGNRTFWRNHKMQMWLPVKDKVIVVYKLCMKF